MGEVSMSVALPDARTLSVKELETLRLRAIHGRELGYHAYQVAKILGVTRETVSRWWTDYQARGIEALTPHPPGPPEGTGAALSPDQAEEVQQVLDSKSPEEAGIPAPLWNRRAVGQLIEKKCGVKLAVRTAGKYLAKWGYTSKRPTRHARLQDPQEVREWIDNVYPHIEKRAAREGAEIYWCDETGVMADQHPGYGYARKGQPATIEVPDRHLGVNTISAITNEGKVRFMTYEKTFTAAVFLMFLARLLRGASGKLFVIVDRLQAHDTAAVEAWALAHQDRLELFYMPSRAPELNPDEYLNNALKQEVHRECLPADKESLKDQVLKTMSKFARLPQMVANLFFHPDVQYAAAVV
jgi:transposase